MTGCEFETAYARLETILGRMNSGQVPLEDSLKLYEEADTLIRRCSQKLTEAEKRIEILVKNREGALEPEPFVLPSSSPLGGI
jgi:exodeoxyribonuclease VII small subunit